MYLKLEQPPPKNDVLTLHYITFSMNVCWMDENDQRKVKLSGNI